VLVAPKSSASLDKHVTAIQELGHVTRECPGVLKQRSMTRVGVDDELGTWQMFAEYERVDGRDHSVVVAVSPNCQTEKGI
jgi:hypothetical protein